MIKMNGLEASKDLVMKVASIGEAIELVVITERMERKFSITPVAGLVPNKDVSKTKEYIGII